MKKQDTNKAALHAARHAAAMERRRQTHASLRPDKTTSVRNRLMLSTVARATVTK